MDEILSERVKKLHRSSRILLTNFTYLVDVHSHRKLWPFFTDLVKTWSKHMHHYWYHTSSLCLPAQGARTEHVPVPPPLWRGRLNHPPGYRIPNSGQHLPWTQPQEGRVQSLIFLIIYHFSYMLHSIYLISQWQHMYIGVMAKWFRLKNKLDHFQQNSLHWSHSLTSSNYWSVLWFRDLN